ncbi:MAG: C4-type zinc ribbon domain-containing protein [Armatimonadota bacterium]|nr:C4-type zinc ribbon domain-containing protein [Armatimonadota bacterium]
MDKQDFNRLYKLQMIDSAIDRRRELLETIDDGTEVLQRLEQARERLDQLQKSLREMQARHRKLELDLQTVEAEKQEKSDRAYGGTVSDPKELSALEQKIQELTRNVERHEDMILELLEEIDDVEEAVEAQQQRVDRLQTEHDEITETYQTTTAQAREEIEQLQEQRQEVVSELEPALTSQYEQLRERLGGVAVAAVVDETCQACQVAVPHGRIPTIERGDSVVRCENCLRILVIPDEEE